MSRSLALSALLAAGLATSACGSSHDTSADGIDEQDWVVQSTFNRAYTIVRGVDYLPFNYKQDGCYARALFMSMELAANKMESDAVFAFAQDGTALVVGDIQWGYHVAPMLEVAGMSGLTHMIIDPSLADKAITQDQWVALMGYAKDATDHPFMLVVPGSDYAPQEAIADVAHRQHDVTNFVHMPAFKASDVQNACQVMYAYIAREASATAAAKQQKLVARSDELVTALRANGKLVDDAPFDASACVVVEQQ
jgi:hypothetical protein